MKTLAALTAAAMLAMPGVAFACNFHEQHAMSCAAGMVYDDETRTCVQTTG